MSAKAATQRKGSDGEIPMSAYVAAFGPQVRRLLAELRKVVKELAPGAKEKAYRGWGLYVTTDRGAVGLNAFRDHVNVTLPASIRDPHGLLEGSGKQTRHVKVRGIEDAHSDALLVRISLQSDHPFRSNPITRFGRIRSAVSEFS